MIITTICISTAVAVGVSVYLVNRAEKNHDAEMQKITEENSRDGLSNFHRLDS